MSITDIILIILIAAAVAGAIYLIVRGRKCGGCCGDCSRCAGHKDK